MSVETAMTMCKEMLTSRGYTLGDDDSFTNNKAEKGIILFGGEDKFNVPTFHAFVQKTEEETIKHVVVIYQTGITPQVLVASRLIEKKGTVFEFFKVEELQFNITKHVLVPKFRKVDDMHPFLEKNRSSLPILLTSDPIARFYLFRVGDIVEIVTSSSTYYRHVQE